MSQGYQTSSLTPTTIVPPGTITDLAVLEEGTGTVTLTWTAPGAHGDQGQAAAYDVRWAEQPITESGFLSAAQIQRTPSPQAPGTTETLTVSNLLS